VSSFSGRWSGHDRPDLLGSPSRTCGQSFQIHSPSCAAWHQCCPFRISSLCCIRGLILWFFGYACPLCAASELWIFGPRRAGWTTIVMTVAPCWAVMVRGLLNYVAASSARIILRIRVNPGHKPAPVSEAAQGSHPGKGLMWFGNS